MAFFPRQHYKRRGAKQCAVCDLCGQWVDVQDLILCDVEGLRGYYVCSSHPWEKMARVNPSFNDRGGVGQVQDPGHDFLPAPGNALSSPWNALLFSGGTQYVTLSNVTVPTNPLSLEFLIYLNAGISSDQVILQLGNGAASGWVVRLAYSFSIPPIPSTQLTQMTTYPTVRTSTGGQINPGGLHRVSIVQDLPGVSFYVDGILATGPTAVHLSWGSPGTTLIFGADGSHANGLDGVKITDLRIWNIALDSDTINTYLFAPIYGQPTGLVYNWQMGEGSGTTLATSFPTGAAGVISGPTWTTIAATSELFGSLP